MYYVFLNYSSFPKIIITTLLYATGCLAFPQKLLLAYPVLTL